MSLNSFIWYYAGHKDKMSAYASVVEQFKCLKLPFFLCKWNCRWFSAKTTNLFTSGFSTEEAMTFRSTKELTGAKFVAILRMLYFGC